MNQARWWLARELPCQESGGAHTVLPPGAVLLHGCLRGGLVWAMGDVMDSHRLLTQHPLTFSQLTASWFSSTRSSRRGHECGTWVTRVLHSEPHLGERGRGTNPGHARQAHGFSVDGNKKPFLFLLGSKGQ